MASAARSNLHRKSSAPLNREPGKKHEKHIDIELFKMLFDCFIGLQVFLPLGGGLRTCYLGCLVDADCIVQADVLRADEFTVSLQNPQLKGA